MKNIMKSLFMENSNRKVRIFIFILFFFSIISIEIKAQPYCNEWINYSQSYYKIKVVKEGIYRIPYAALISAGVPIGSFDPRSFQVFHNGDEQYIIVKNENTGVFSTNDYIEFYANKNNGFLDAQMFNMPSNAYNNPNYSLFNDTATYFLTWNSNFTNKRFSLIDTINFSPYTPQPYFYAVTHQDYVNRYFYGETNSLGATDAEYSMGEGWFDYGITLGDSPLSKYISTPNVYSLGPPARLSMIVIGASSTQHHIQLSMPGYQIDTSYFGYKILHFNRNISTDNLTTSSAGNPVTLSLVADPGVNADANTIEFIEIKYPQTYNLNNSSSYRMYVPDQQNQDKAYLNITNFNVATSDSAMLYDLTNHKKILVVKNGPTYSALVANTGGEKLCYITSTGHINNVSSLMPVNIGVSNYAKFTDYNAPPYNISDYLIVTHKSLMSAVLDYKDYRSSTGYHVLVADIDELYDQFAWGVRKHPLAIRNFAHFAYNKFSVTPKFLFLIGKSLNAVDYRNNSSNYASTLVPTFGVPPSDNLFTSRVIDTLFQPAIPTGRLAAQNVSHVNLYLQKVIDYEVEQQLAQQNPPLWMKNILHFGGGGNVNEQAQISMYLSLFKNVIKDTLFGGYVRTFLKTSSAPIQINQSDSLRTIINNGVSLMTFFGHASGTGFDQSIDNPSEYQNDKRYPFLFANSCYAGDIFSTGWSSSEAFVLIQNKGVIGYLASTALSPSSALEIYAKSFYDNISFQNYGKPIGKCIQQTIKNIQNTSNPFIKEICLVSILHGDPAIKLNSFEKPDFEVTSSSIYYTPENVSTEVDSFTVHVISTNKGRAVPGHFIVEVKRTYPDGSTTSTYSKQIPATKYKDTIAFKLPVDMATGIGINTLKVTLDLNDEINYEITKANNIATVNLIIKANYIVPVFPAKYAIVPDANITLKASTGDPFIGTKNYIFQLDTIDSFDSQFLKVQHVTHAGGLVTWQLPFALTDSTVYYWRTSLDNATPNWRESSFQYIANKRGWGQSHFFQFKNDSYQYVNYSKLTRSFVFFNNFKLVNVQAGIYGYLPWDEEWYKLNGSVMDIWSCLSDVGNGMKFAVFNPVSGEPWISHQIGSTGGGQYGNDHCKAYDVPAFDFFTDYPPNSAGFRHRITKFLDTIPNGYYVLAFNHRNHFAQEFEEDLYQAFESIGSANIRLIQDNTPYIIFGKKGDLMGFAHEVVGLTAQQTIQLTDSIKTKWNQGYIKSELIGPASKWNSLHWRYKAVNNIATDSVRLSVIGVKINGQQDTIFHGISPDSLDIFNLNTVIDAHVHPYLYLIAYMKDDSMHTPAQMKRWQVLYDGVPETCLNPSAHFFFHKDTLKQGEKLVFSCAIQNIGTYNMDSLLVAYWIIDKDRNKIPIPYHRQRPHPVGDILIDTITFQTNNLSALNSFWVEVNPNNDQLEQNHINNIGDIPFYVKVDKTNPLLDITFDGIHILDGDIVSAKPKIQIVLRDENKFMAVNDTSLFKVFLKRPGMIDPERVYFIKNGTEIIKFYPATLPENVCRLEYNTGLLPDGTYELSVQAKDASHNTSGYNDFKISFEVINKATITEVLNYPNPFSTSTRFVFTLTGSEVPTYMKIQIMTITGKIVREIDMSELGNIHIGRNITQYAWDGRDEFGDRLANGVYLYRVVTRMNDKSIDLNQTSASKYFNHEFGKMYLFR